MHLVASVISMSFTCLFWYGVLKCEVFYSFTYNSSLLQLPKLPKLSMHKVLVPLLVSIIMGFQCI